MHVESKINNKYTKQLIQKIMRQKDRDIERQGERELLEEIDQKIVLMRYRSNYIAGEIGK